jgi:myo-inositol-hexaphosphate 3-phosphohydrolase
MRARVVGVLLGTAVVGLGLLGPSTPVHTGVQASQAAEPVQHVADVAVARNSATPWVDVPTQVRAGDRLLLLLSVNSATREASEPGGVGSWTAEGDQASRSMRTRVWSRVATDADAGRRITVTLDGRSKATMHLVAYRNVAPGSLTVVPKAETDTSTVRRTPVVELPGDAWVASLWATKSASVTSWTPPAGVTVRASVHNSGSGRIASLLADSGSPAPAGTYGDLAARTDAASSAATTWTVVLGQATEGEEPPPSGGVRQVSADVETDPVPQSGDAADDPAVWVHPTAPDQSLVIGNDKQGGLEVYGLDGRRLQRITTSTSFWGNVDVRQGVRIGGETRDVVVGYNAGLRTFEVDVATRRLVPVGDGTGTIPTNGGEGLCAYDSAQTGDLSVFVITRGGRVRQYRIHDADGDRLLQGSLVREFFVGSEAEGCVADDTAGVLYVSEEDRGLWRYGAEPGSGSARTLVDAIAPDGHLAYDVEGVTLAETGPTSGHLVVSAQNGADPDQSYFVVYDRETNAYVSSFRIAGGTAADGCERTDGIAAQTGDLGAAFPAGVFVCQDNGNASPAPGNQNFKLTRLDKILPGT